MKYVKTLLPVVVAAVALTAVLGVSSASATVLCKTQGIGSPTGTTCPVGWAYTAGTQIHAVLDPGTKSVTTTGFENIECEESTITGKTENEGSAFETVELSMEALTYGKCSCEPKVITRGKMEIHWIEGTHNGTVTWDGSELTVNCSTIFGAVHCIYVMNDMDIGTLTGGNPATLDISIAYVLHLSTHFICDEKAEWDAKYQITTPTPLYVTGHT